MQTELRHVRVDQIDEPEIPSRLDLDEESIHELAASIARQGLLEPIGVKPYGPSDRYRLCYGMRRLRAVRSLGWFVIPAIIVPAHISEDAARQHENNQRVQLTPVEEARELRRYIDHGETIPALAARMSRSPTWVQQRLRLLRYQDDVLTAVHKHGLALTVADLLSQITHDAYRAMMLDEALRHGATAATAAAWLAHWQANQARVEANADTIEHLAATRHEFKVYAPCEYCGDSTELQLTRVWRLCQTCTTGLVTAKHHAAS